MKYIVQAEEVSTHTVVVEALDSDDAAEQYVKGNIIEDQGYTYDVDSGLVLSVEEAR